MSSQYPFPRCSDSKPEVTWLFHAAKVQLFFETTKFYGIFSVTITIISIFSFYFCILVGKKNKHPEASTWFVANTFEISQKHVRNIYSYMEDGEKH